jgi:hypothetical protein
MNAVPTSNIQYPSEPGKLLGSQLGNTIYNDLETAKHRCNQLIQCSGVAYRRFNQKYTLRSGVNLTVPQSPIFRNINGTVVRDMNIFDSYIKQISTTNINLNYIDQLIPETNQRSHMAMKVIENQIGLGLEGFTDTVDQYQTEISNQIIQFNVDTQSLNTKYLNLIYDVEKENDRATFYAIQRNLVLVLVLIVLLVRNELISTTTGMVAGGFIALIMGSYYVFRTYFSTYRRDPLEWDELIIKSIK